MMFLRKIKQSTYLLTDAELARNRREHCLWNVLGFLGGLMIKNTFHLAEFFGCYLFHQWYGEIIDCNLIAEL